MNILGVRSGVGRHQYYLELNQIIEALKWSQLSRLFFVLVTFFTKVSICLFVIRIPQDRNVSTFLWITIGLLAITNVAWFIEFLAQCRPIAGLWDPTIAANCWNPYIEVDFDYTQGGKQSATSYIETSLRFLKLWNQLLR